MIKNFSLQVFAIYFFFSPFMLNADTLWQSVGNNIYNANAGNIGIGTNSPESPLTIKTATGKYGLIHTDGSVKLGTFIWNTSTPGGWLGTQSNHNLYFFTNNSNPRVTIDTAGRMGVGTTTPFYPLEVFGSVGIGNTSNGYIFSNRNREIIAGMDPTGFYFAGGASSENTLPINIGDNNSVIKFSAGNQQRMTIVGSTGNVGIGTSNPTQKLSISGGGLLFDNNQAIKFKDSSGNERNIIYVSPANNVTVGAPPTGDIYVGSSPAFVVKSNGNVGVGTATPDATFMVNNTGASYISKFRRNGGAGSLAINVDNYLGSSTRDVLLESLPDSLNNPAGFLFRTRNGGSSYNALSISGNGNVGIGTLSSTEKLTLSGGYFRMISGADKGGDINVGTYMTDVTGNNEFMQSTGGKPSYSSGYRVTPSGTAATVQLNTATDFRWYTPNGLVANVASNPLTPDMVFTGGKLGIGTSSPKAKLDVVGDIKITGNLISDGDICIGKCQ